MSVNESSSQPIERLIQLLHNACGLVNGSNSIQITIENGNAIHNCTRTPDEETGADHGAVMYIVAVLVFYSAGIVIMLIKYSRSERKRMEEEVALDFFFKGMPFGKSTKEHNVNSVAIRAFHTMTMSAYEPKKNHIIPKPLLETDVWHKPPSLLPMDANHRQRELLTETAFTVYKRQLCLTIASS